MNSVIVALALFGAIVAVASASEFEGGEFEHGLHGHGGHGGHGSIGHGSIGHLRGGLGRGGHHHGGEGFGEGLEEEELLRRRHEGGFGGGLGGVGARRGGRNFRRGLPRSGFGGGIGGGAIGAGLRSNENSGLLAGESEGFNEAGLAENRRGGVLANKKGIRGSQSNFNNDDVGSFHKHNVLDKDTLVVKNNVKAINDEDGSHASHSNAGSTSFGAGSDNLAAFGEEGRLAGRKNINRDSSIAAGQNSNLEAAGGAIGGGAIL